MAGFVYYQIKDTLALTGADDSESCENRNGAASALLHIDESDGVDEMNRQRNKNRRRSEPRQVQTGKSNTKVGGCGSCLPMPVTNVNVHHTVKKNVEPSLLQWSCAVLSKSRKDAIRINATNALF